MNQSEIEDFLNKALGEGFDVQKILNNLVSSRKQDTNTRYIFGVKMQDECLDPDYWDGPCIGIVSEQYWRDNHHLDDRHLTRKLHLPDGFSEETESLFSYHIDDGDTVTRDAVIGKLLKAGFRHSQELQDWLKQHDP